MHRICEAYPGISPLAIEEMSLDQIYTLWNDAESLEKGVPVRRMSMGEACRAGVVQHPEGGKSLFQRIRERQAAQRDGLDPEAGTKRERRRRRAAALKRAVENTGEG